MGSYRVSKDFVVRHRVWDEQRVQAAAELRTAVRAVDFVRVVVTDVHGLPRSKTYTRDAFLGVLGHGATFSSTLFLFDTGGCIAPEYLSDGAGVGVPELQGAGNFVAVPDPLTFRILPHTSRPTGWVLADEYLRSGVAHPLSTRRVLRTLDDKLRSRGWRHLVGLEIEWCLTSYVDPGEAGSFGVQGKPPEVRPIDAGHQLNLDGLTDALEPVLDPLADALLRLGLPLRSIEHESGPGQLEFTFAPMDSLDAADAVTLIRAVVKQVCHRLGHHATFMALPGIRGLNPSGWHLHQSLAPRATSGNLFSADASTELLSPLGRAFLGGLLHHACAGTVLGTPTVNGYRRYSDRFGFAPHAVGWSDEHRSALVRVLGGGSDPETHLESRMGEPCANPYLYIASQLSAGLDGIDRQLDPGAPLMDPPVVDAATLPDSLAAALAACLESDHYRQLLGAPLSACWEQLKRSELERYGASHGECAGDPATVTDWEHREYFHDF